MVGNETYRQIFIQSAIKFVRDNDFDGMDFDWEFPFGDDDKANYPIFLKELYQAVEAESKNSGKSRLLITAAVAQGYHNTRDGYNISAMAPWVDWVGVMTYDFHNWVETNYTDHNSPLMYGQDTTWENDTYECIKYSTNTWYTEGMPKDKIVVGFPSYGNGWTLLNISNDGFHAPATAPKIGQGWYHYTLFCDWLKQGAKRTFDFESFVPWMVLGDQWYTYDDGESYTWKLRWIKQMGYGGAFVWEIASDDWAGHCNSSVVYPLIGTIAWELAGISITKTSTPTSSTKSLYSVNHFFYIAVLTFVILILVRKSL